MRYFLSLVILFAAATVDLPGASAATKCEAGAAGKAFTDIRAEVEKRISNFAGKKPIAEKADEMLSKLIGAKSPVIKSWMTARNLDDKPEDEIVKEWRMYFAKNFVLSKYPNDDPAVNSEIETLVDGIVALYATPEFRERMEKLFARSKEGAITTIKGFKLPAEKSILERIGAIKLHWPQALKTTEARTIPLEIVDWGVAYDPIANKINMGVNALSYSNDETYLAVFAHEIGHSFDSCRWTAFFSEAWPFEKVGKCLRSSKSVGAKKRDDSRLGAMTKSGQVSEDLSISMWKNPTCNKSEYPPVGVQADQLPESFADWFAAEVIGPMANLDRSKIRTDLCETRKIVTGSSYPTNEMRLKRIYNASKSTKCRI